MERAPWRYTIRFVFCRALVTPVLAQAVLLARANLSRGSGADLPVLSPEHGLSGTKAWGPVDYIILYRMLAIVVVEAKRLDLAGAWAQLIMQIRSVRELMLVSLGIQVKKRKVFQAQELEKVDTFAVICTADSYRLVRFRPGNNTTAPSLVTSSLIQLPLSKLSTLEELEIKMEGLVRKLACMVCDAVAIIDRAKEAEPKLSTTPESLLETSGGMAEEEEEEEEG